MNFAILITAAGLSQRFRKRGGGNKLLSLLQDKPVLQHTVENALATGMHVYVISRPEDCKVHAIVKQANLITFASGGLGDSIAAGVRATGHYDGWIIALGDMPLLATASYLAVGDALSASPLVRSVVDGIAGHPVGFQKSFYRELVTLKGDIGARKLLRCHTVTLVELKDTGCLSDIDTPSALNSLSQKFKNMR